MRIAYANTYYQTNNTGGGHVHMHQFITNAVTLGHEVWAWSSNQHPQVCTVPTRYLNFVKAMRQMDALYIRLERNPPKICKWTLPPHRIVYGFPVVIWEFNTIPEEGLMRGQPEEDVARNIHFLRQYGPGCDLAVCVSPASADYVQSKLGIRQVMVVPNGSDPELFRPDLPPVRRMSPFRGRLNVVWIGSAGIDYHDFDMLQETAQLLWKRGDSDHIVFHIIGPDLKFIMADMPPSVYYWGAEKYQRLPHWLAAMDIGLYLSHGGPSAFGAPLKVFDYMASGLAVVATSHPFIGDLFDQLGQSDLLVPQGKPELLADVLVDLQLDSERIHRQGQAGRQLVIERYNWRQAVQDTVDKIEIILRRKRAK
jgi:glycosyltransferase involved in cell wall biosynthesis